MCSTAVYSLFQGFTLSLQNRKLPNRCSQTVLLNLSRSTSSVQKERGGWRRSLGRSLFKIFMLTQPQTGPETKFTDDGRIQVTYQEPAALQRWMELNWPRETERRYALSREARLPRLRKSS